MTVVIDSWKREKPSPKSNFYNCFGSFTLFNGTRVASSDSNSLVLYKECIANKINKLNNIIETLQIQAEIIEISQNNNIPLSSNPSDYNNIFFINNLVLSLNNELILYLNHQLNMESTFTNTTHEPDSVISIF